MALYQVVRTYNLNGVTDYASMGITTYQRAIDWCADANLHCAEYGFPFSFDFYKLEGLDLELEALGAAR